MPQRGKKCSVGVELKATGASSGQTPCDLVLTLRFREPLPPSSSSAHEPSTGFCLSASEEARLKCAPFGGIAKLEHDDVMLLRRVFDGWNRIQIVKVAQDDDHAGPPRPNHQFTESQPEPSGFVDANLTKRF